MFRNDNKVRETTTFRGSTDNLQRSSTGNTGKLYRTLKTFTRMKNRDCV